MAFTIKILLDTLHLIKRLVGFCFQTVAAGEGNMSATERRSPSHHVVLRLRWFQGQLKICFRSVQAASVPHTRSLFLAVAKKDDSLMLLLEDNSLNPPKVEPVFKKKNDKPKLNKEWLQIIRFTCIFFWCLGTSGAFRESISSVKNIVSGIMPG